MNAARSFAHWLDRNAALLHEGHEVLLPFTLPHPSSVGFKAASLASFGQLRDWTLALRKGRLVVHELAHGQCIIRLERGQGAQRRERSTLVNGTLAAVKGAAMATATASVGVLAAALVSVGARVARGEP